MRILLPLLVILAGCAHHAAPVAQAPNSVQKHWKNRAEYKLANAAQNETDAKKRVDFLNQWAAKYPKTQFLDVRLDSYMQAYAELKEPRLTFDTAQEILKTRPASLRALAQTIQWVIIVKPGPTTNDLDAGERAALTLLDNPAVFAAANKPKETAEADWAKNEPLVKRYAENILVQIYVARHDDRRAVNDLTKLLERDPNLPAASYQLGASRLKVIQAERRLEDQPQALYHFARALAYTGLNELTADQKQSIKTYLTRAFTAYYRSTQPLQLFLDTAKDNAFPPPGFFERLPGPVGDPALSRAVDRDGYRR